MGEGTPSLRREMYLGPDGFKKALDKLHELRIAKGGWYSRYSALHEQMVTQQLEVEGIPSSDYLQAQAARIVECIDDMAAITRLSGRGVTDELKGFQQELVTTGEGFLKELALPTLKFLRAINALPKK